MVVGAQGLEPMIFRLKAGCSPSELYPQIGARPRIRTGTLSGLSRATLPFAQPRVARPRGVEPPRPGFGGQAPVPPASAWYLVGSLGIEPSVGRFRRPARVPALSPGLEPPQGIEPRVPDS